MLAGANLVGGSRSSRSSSASTGPNGLSGFAKLLKRNGHLVQREGGALDSVRLDTDTTLIVLDMPTLSERESVALARFLRAGGRAVMGGRNPGAWIGVVLGDGAPVWSPVGPKDVTPAAPVPEVEGVARVHTAGEGVWSDPRAILPILGCSGGTVAGVVNVGNGRAVVLADASPLQNRLLAQVDDAAFGLVAVGPAGRPVIFADHGHGASDPSGFAALPLRVRVALGVLVAAIVVAMAARGSRLGPPARSAEGRAARRSDYVDALGGTLARTGSPAAAVPLQVAAADLVRRRSGLPVTAPVEELRAAALQLGLTPDEAAAVISPITTDAQASAAGRALARLRSPATATTPTSATPQGPRAPGEDHVRERTVGRKLRAGPGRCAAPPAAAP